MDFEVLKKWNIYAAMNILMMTVINMKEKMSPII